MDSEKLIIRLHHSGNFMKTRYIGDKCETYDVERDYFSYSVLMEFVKELKYDEIGGVYIKQRGWKLVTDDRGVNDATNERAEVDFYIDNNVDPDVPPMKQMQPHVIVRPKSSPFKVKEKHAEKRTFVTLQNINAEKTRRMKDMNVEKERRLITKKKLEFNHEDANHVTGEPSPKLAVNDVDEPGTNAGQSGLVETGGNKEMVNPVEGQGCNEYEMQRNKNIAKNQEKFAALGIPILTKSVSEKGKRELKQPNEAAGESDYLPSNEDGGESENDEVDIATSKKIKRTKRQRVVQSTTDGPRTRGQAAKLVDKSQNKEAASEPLPVEKNDAHVPTAKERLQALKSGPGSMLAYNKLRELEKLQIETEVAEGESGTQQMMAESGDTPGEVSKRKRGKTKMNHVHNSTEKKIVTLNDKFQPVSCGGNNSISELSNFLGTTLRQFVPLTCASWRAVPEKELLWEYVKDKYIIPEEAKSWVFTTMSDQFRSHKSRIKRNYYTKYATDEERLENRPRDVSLEDWKILLAYWGDEKIKDKARKNIIARQNVKESHTTGPRTFAQVVYNMQLERLDKLPIGIEDDEAEELLKISDADVYLKTRKRDKTREYKLTEKEAEELDKRFKNVEQTLKTDGAEAANKLVHDKEHKPSYLIGRLIRKKEEKKQKAALGTTRTLSVPGHEYAKIRADIEKELDEKLEQKFQDMVKKLAEQNPGLKINLDESDKSTEAEVEAESVGTDHE